MTRVLLLMGKVAQTCKRLLPLKQAGSKPEGRCGRGGHGPQTSGTPAWSSAFSRSIECPPRTPPNGRAPNASRQVRSSAFSVDFSCPQDLLLSTVALAALAGCKDGLGRKNRFNGLSP